MIDISVVLRGMHDGITHHWRRDGELSPPPPPPPSPHPPIPRQTHLPRLPLSFLGGQFRLHWGVPQLSIRCWRLQWQLARGNFLQCAWWVWRVNQRCRASFSVQPSMRTFSQSLWAQSSTSKFSRRFKEKMCQ